ncbi:Transcriptional regulator of ribosomal biogenesis proteins [Vermiconidia calcicola]|uniref:Transcriptional regulator of ribosomal biogenesis proteins n=1 Tax=Vermiconidia calcicola TaxID=1690605 RepID=A0ACC3N623_9PEZI|nr:Transcriptional regulator of ribosomal biogenesis proteins [Vermiconidia calcicola]
MVAFVSVETVQAASGRTSILLEALEGLLAAMAGPSSGLQGHLRNKLIASLPLPHRIITAGSSKPLLKLATSSQTPPPLHFPSGRESSVESTPISTPSTAGYNFPKRSSKEYGRFSNPQKKRGQVHVHNSFNSDELLFPSDNEETDIPLFPTASPQPPRSAMSGTASPIDIATSRQSSKSPRGQHSNLTSQLQQPKIDVQHDTSDDRTYESDMAQGGRQESIGMFGTTPFGARSIPKRDGQRRESNANGMSGSYMAGMSWGGMSMSSFIRDDVLMMGTSPYQFGSPSYHSSSYLPKMEANYMKDYVCCDIHLDSMHELLQHYEEAHAAQPTQTMGRTPRDLQFPSGRAANAASTAQAVQQQTQAQQPNLPQQLAPQRVPSAQTNHSPFFSGQSHDQMGAFDSLDDMDMDDGNTASHMHQQGSSQFQPQPQFGRQQHRGPSVNVNLANAFQGQGLNSADPATPHASQQAFQHNPTVSSVNTLGSAQTSLSQQNSTPESSMPGTPAEPDFDYNSQLANLNLDYSQLMAGKLDSSNLNNGGSGTIDDPAKRLLSKQGYGSKGFANQSVANNSELAKRVREQQLLNGLAGAGGFVGEEIKPFKCPVIGCEKAYKNQNGLKYHKQHGHQNQQLKENPDGSFSIVDPTTSIPYPGTMGMEKEKPYRCDVCGKRYKNLNGLKYHRQHSPQCNPELKLNTSNVGGVPGNMQGVNVAGAGLLGINDGMGY